MDIKFVFDTLITGVYIFSVAMVTVAFIAGLWSLPVVIILNIDDLLHPKHSKLFWWHNLLLIVVYSIAWVLLLFILGYVFNSYGY